MEFEKLKREAISLEVALDRISKGSNTSYQWFSVRNKKDCLFEVGGYVKSGKLEFKASIPKFIDGNYVIYENSYVNTNYSLTNWNSIEYPTFYSFHNLDEKELIKFLDNTDFKTYTPKVEEIEIVKYSTTYKAKL